MNVWIDVEQIKEQLRSALYTQLKEEIINDLREAERGSRSPIPGYITAAEAADVLRCSVRRIYRLVETGQLKATKDGRRVLVLEEGLRRHLGEAA